ncbi:hypothetical protein JCM19239_7803 [Vibrio variabilis]|uniref:Uncharacterized protein n=1 Tax=Vibrio variabilis TaxID=990271 RepID=A0ABQ0J536_9VIBR|nr:hypothetical protein JCM19239_7803 [Vibrio variabilis]
MSLRDFEYLTQCRLTDETTFSGFTKVSGFMKGNQVMKLL